eukprot:TRINITY_DN29847_c0_g1_i1.p1 TRINITY_DN29847_c0_g1~~TRINITY_DN29847_c0_g1_i1.p1  ORF type:complete len:372 (+),score=72.55 TRINITY_DN29847_c0_g1_i1:52-1167(+)
MPLLVFGGSAQRPASPPLAPRKLREKGEQGAGRGALRAFATLALFRPHLSRTKPPLHQLQACPKPPSSKVSRIRPKPPRRSSPAPRPPSASAPQRAATAGLAFRAHLQNAERRQREYKSNEALFEDLLSGDLLAQAAPGGSEDPKPLCRRPIRVVHAAAPQWRLRQREREREKEAVASPRGAPDAVSTPSPDPVDSTVRTDAHAWREAAEQESQLLLHDLLGGVDSKSATMNAILRRAKPLLDEVDERLREATKERMSHSQRRRKLLERGRFGFPNCTANSSRELQVNLDRIMAAEPKSNLCHILGILHPDRDFTRRDPRHFAMRMPGGFCETPSRERDSFDSIVTGLPLPVLQANAAPSQPVVTVTMEAP